MTHTPEQLAELTKDKLKEILEGLGGTAGARDTNPTLIEKITAAQEAKAAAEGEQTPTEPAPTDEAPAGDPVGAVDTPSDETADTTTDTPEAPAETPEETPAEETTDTTSDTSTDASADVLPSHIDPAVADPEENDDEDEEDLPVGLDVEDKALTTIAVELSALNVGEVVLGHTFIREDKIKGMKHLVKPLKATLFRKNQTFRLCKVK